MVEICIKNECKDFEKHSYSVETSMNLPVSYSTDSYQWKALKYM